MDNDALTSQPIDQQTTSDDMKSDPVPSSNQLAWLCRGLDQPGGKLPLFDGIGKKISEQTVRSCLRQGWAEPWFNNPIKPDWLICRLTDKGRQVAEQHDHPLR